MISDERLEEMAQHFGTPGDRTVLSSADELGLVCAELQTRRAASATAAKVVDVEGLRWILRYCDYNGRSEYATILDSHLAALEAGVTECPYCDGARMDGCHLSTIDCATCTIPLNERRCYPCPKCHGAGRVVILAVKEEKEEDE